MSSSITSFFSPKAGTSSKRNRAKDEDTETESNKRAKTSEVEELLSHLHEEGWKEALQTFTSRSSFSSLAKFIAKERATEEIFPPAEDTFAALNLTPLSDVKVVIVGQDPYHGPGQAHGLCFSVRKGVRVPPSLKNMYKELLNDTDVDFPRGGGAAVPKHGFLERWAKQGVLLLNNVLTVQQGQPNSHKKKGWEAFTDEVIRVLLKEAKKQKRKLIFLLWGKPAAKKANDIIGKTTSHVVITTSHPSPLGATKGPAPFIDSKCFSRANTALEEMGLDPIDWNVDDEEAAEKED